MHISTYNKKKRDLLAGLNFATSKLAALEMEVMDYLTCAVTAYHTDGNVDHAKAAGILTEGFNSRWTVPFFKAVKDCRGIHSTFKIVVAPEVVKFSYTPIAKDKQPEVLPTLAEVIDIMLATFSAGKRSKPPLSDAEKLDRAVKSAITMLGKTDVIRAAFNGLDFESANALATMMHNTMQAKWPTAGVETSTPVDSETVDAHPSARPSDTQLALLASTLTQ